MVVPLIFSVVYRLTRKEQVQGQSLGKVQEKVQSMLQEVSGKGPAKYLPEESGNR